MPSDPATLDPRRGGDLSSSMLHFLLYDGLTRMNPNGKAELSLAKELIISEDRKSYLFHLKDVVWSDGSPITAWDFENSWKNILSPSFPSLNAHLLYPIKNAILAKTGAVPLSEVAIYAKDAKTLLIELENPTPYFLELISFCVFFPIKSKSDQFVEKGMVTSGPFFVKSWKYNNEMVLMKNNHYHRKEEIFLDSIHISMIDNEMTALQMFEKEQIDLLGQIPTDAIPDLLKKGLVQIRPTAATTFCVFNTSQPPFSNKKIRKAFSFAINRNEIIFHITQLDEKEALGMIPPILKGRESKYFKDADIEYAKQLFAEGLKELGMLKKDFPEIHYLYSNSEKYRKIAQAIQYQWKKALDIDIKLEKMDHKILIDRLAKRDFFLAQTHWVAQYNDPMNIFERFKYKTNVKNYPHWENQTYIDLLNRSFFAADKNERQDILEEAEKIFIEEMPIAPIFHWNSAFIAKPYLKNVDFAPLGNCFFEKISINHENH